MQYFYSKSAGYRIYSSKQNILLLRPLVLSKQIDIKGINGTGQNYRLVCSIGKVFDYESSDPGSIPGRCSALAYIEVTKVKASSTGKLLDSLYTTLNNG